MDRRQLLSSWTASACCWDVKQPTNQPANHAAIMMVIYTWIGDSFSPLGPPLHAAGTFQTANQPTSQSCRHHDGDLHVDRRQLLSSWTASACCWDVKQPTNQPANHAAIMMVIYTWIGDSFSPLGPPLHAAGTLNSQPTNQPIMPPS